LANVLETRSSSRRGVPSLRPSRGAQPGLHVSDDQPAGVVARLEGCTRGENDGLPAARPRGVLQTAHVPDIILSVKDEGDVLDPLSKKLIRDLAGDPGHDFDPGFRAGREGERHHGEIQRQPGERPLVQGQVLDGLPFFIGDIDVDELEDDRDFVLQRLRQVLGLPGEGEEERAGRENEPRGADLT